MATSAPRTVPFRKYYARGFASCVVLVRLLVLAVCLIRWIVHYKAPTNKHLAIHHTVHHRAMVTEALAQLHAAAEAIDTEVRFRRPRVAARASSCAFLSRSRRRSASASAACDAAVSSASASSSAPTSTRPLCSSSAAQRRSRAAVRSIFSRSSNQATAACRRPPAPRRVRHAAPRSRPPCRAAAAWPLRPR